MVAALPPVAAVAPAVMIVSVLRYVVVAAAMAAVVAWLRRGPERPQRQIQTRDASYADRARERRASLRTALIFGGVALLTVAGIRAGVMTLITQPTPLQTMVSVIAILLWHDLYFYWTHRAMHHRRIFGWMHREHHRSVTPTAWAAYAFSVPEALVQAAFLPLWMLVVPTPAGATFIVLLVMIVRNVMGHAGHELHARGWVDHPVLQWVNTTVHHDLHHSGGFRTNYGLYFTWCDRLFGTEHRDYRARFRALTA